MHEGRSENVQTFCSFFKTSSIFFEQYFSKFLCYSFFPQNIPHISSPVTVLSKTFFLSRFNYSKTTFAKVTLCAFRSSDSYLDTHLALTFLIPRFSRKILCADALPILYLLPTPSNVFLQSLLTKACKS